MMAQELLEKLAEAVSSYHQESAKRLAREALERGIKPLDAVEQGLSKGLLEVGRRFEAREIFLADLLLSAETFKAGLEVLEPEIAKITKTRKMKGRIVLGTVRGDAHDLGKDIVSVLLKAAGYSVVDLGVDVLPEKFVESVKASKTDIVGMSCLLTTCLNSQRETINALKQAGYMGKVIIGGAASTQKWAEEIGADAAAETASEGVNKIEQLMAQ